MDQLKAGAVKRHQLLRKRLSKTGDHKRSPDMMASLMFGMENFLQFALESGAITEEESSTHLAGLEQALAEAGRNQKGYQANEDPVNRFIDLIGGAISSGRAHLADPKTGSAPKGAEQFGWQREVPSLAGILPTPHEAFRPRGERIGWLSSEDQVWLEPSVAYAAAQKLAADQKSPLNVSEQTLWKRLGERRLVLIFPGEHRIKTRRQIGEMRLYVLCFPRKEIFFGEFGSSAPETSLG